MTAWEAGLHFILGWEGGWVDNPLDKGGETFRGIARKDWPKWEGWAVIDAMKASPDFPGSVNFDEGLERLVAEFYRVNFWEKIHGDELPPAAAVALLDCAVNSGVNQGVRLFQASLGLLSDGIVGSVTVKAAHDAGEDALVEFMARRGAFLMDIMAGDPTQKVWALNWARRVFRLGHMLLVEKIGG